MIIWNLERIIQEVTNFIINLDIYKKNIDMSKNIKKTIRKNLNTLLETKGFEHMEFKSSNSSKKVKTFPMQRKNNSVKWKLSKTKKVLN